MKLSELAEGWKDKLKAPKVTHVGGNVEKFEHPSGHIQITVDYTDPEEVKATIWYATTDPEEKDRMLKDSLPWITDELEKRYNLSVGDADMYEHPEKVDGGLIDNLTWLPLEGGGPVTESARLQIGDRVVVLVRGSDKHPGLVQGGVVIAIDANTVDVEFNDKFWWGKTGEKLDKEQGRQMGGVEPNNVETMVFGRVWNLANALDGPEWVNVD